MKFSRKVFAAAMGAAAVAGCLAVVSVRASDHDDGEIDSKGRSLNLTDLYVFRKDSQTGVSGDSTNLILIMNANPRSLPGQQYFFSSNARYEFHASRVTSKNTRPTGSDDVVLRVAFGDPDATTNVQAMTVTLVKDGAEGTAVTATTGGTAINTTTIVNSKADTLTSNAITVDGKALTVFAGMREDPFFFDVSGFFKTRANILGGNSTATAIAFPSIATGYNAAASDFTAGLNVNSIVVDAPITLFQSSAAETVFDFWETISVKN